jgi:predicted homoserine dehydrogenase-like protein
MPEQGEPALREAGTTAWDRAGSVREAEVAIKRGLPALTDDPSVLTACDAIDLFVEVTGTGQSHGGHIHRDKRVRADAR